MGEQGIVLKNHTDITLFWRDESVLVSHYPAIDLYFSLLWNFQAGDEAQDRTFSATAFA